MSTARALLLSAYGSCAAYSGLRSISGDWSQDGAFVPRRRVERRHRHPTRGKGDHPALEVGGGGQTTAVSQARNVCGLAVNPIQGSSGRSCRNAMACAINCFPTIMTRVQEGALYDWAMPISARIRNPASPARHTRKSNIEGAGPALRRSFLLD